jgi:hypothetical protein
MSRNRYKPGRASAVPPFSAAIGFVFGTFALALAVSMTALISLT